MSTQTTFKSVYRPVTKVIDETLFTSVLDFSGRATSLDFTEIQAVTFNAIDNIKHFVDGQIVIISNRSAQNINIDSSLIIANKAIEIKPNSASIFIYLIERSKFFDITNSGQIDDLQAAVELINANISLIQNTISANYQELTEDLSELSQIVNQAILDEQTQRTLADTELSDRIDQLEIDPVTRAYVDAQDASILEDLSVEIDDRLSFDQDIQNQLNNFSTTTNASLTSLIEKDQTLESNISDLLNQLNQEVTDRTDADTNLQNQINNILSNIDVTALDSLTEIIAAFEAADSSLNGAITNLSTALSQQLSEINLELDQEKLDRAAGDLALDTRITALEEEVGDNLQQAISSLQAADTVLDTRITDLEEQVGENLQAAISQIQLNISAEATTRASADIALQTNITNVESGLSQEITNRVSGDQQLALDLNAEIARATNTEVGLQNQISNLTTDSVTEASNLYYTDERVQTKLANLSGNIIPDTDEAYDLGSPTNKFKDLYLSGFTLYLGGLTLSSNQTTGLVVRNSASELAINSDNIKEGILNKFFTESRVQNSSLSLLDINKSGDVVSTDSLIDGLSKLQNSITFEVNRAQSAESILESAIGNEEASRISGDQYLQNQITNILSNIDPAALDSLAEIVTTLQNSEANINTAISNLAQQVNQDLALEIENRENADTALQNQINLTNLDVESLQALISTQDQEITNLKARVLELETDQDDSLFNIEKITIQSEQDLIYVDLQYKVIPNSIVASIDRLMIYLNDDFETSIVNNVTRITWTGPLHSITGDEKIGIGDILKINYKTSNSVFDSAPTPLILDDNSLFILDDGDQLIF